QHQRLLSPHPLPSLPLGSPLLSPCHSTISYFFLNYASPTDPYTLSLHDALPISSHERWHSCAAAPATHARLPHRSSSPAGSSLRSEEHTSELQSRFDLVCRLLLEKKNGVTFASVSPIKIHLSQKPSSLAPRTTAT